MNLCGKTSIYCVSTRASIEYVVDFIIVEGDIHNVLRKKTCSELHLVKRVDTIEKSITDNYNDVFQGLGCIDGVTHHIKLDEGMKPAIHPPRRVPVTWRPKVKEELDRMENMGVVERVHKPIRLGQQYGDSYQTQRQVY